VKTPRSTALYARISSDQDGSGLGVARQLEDCRRLAQTLGWLVGEEYVDNDVSAFSGKARPQYVRMMEDLRDGIRDGVIAYHVDRLTRRPIELEEFAAATEAADVRHVRFVTSDFDIGTGDGLMMARMMGVIAAHESETKSRRVLRKMDEVAQSGMPHGGSKRAFGYQEDRITIRPDEAEILGTLVARFLAGESLRSLASWMNERQVPTVAGGRWRTNTLRQMLLNPRYAGLRAHRGQVVGRAVWEPIITEEVHHRLVARFAARAVSGRRTPQRYLLSGLLRCGRCETKLYSSARGSSRRYVCLAGPDQGGCGRLTVVADPLERLLADAVILRLDSPALADALTGQSAADEATSALVEAIASNRARLDELAEEVGRVGIPMREWNAARAPIEAQIREAERRLSRATRSDALSGLVGQGQELRAAWDSQNLGRQHAIVSAVLDHATILPGTPGARTLDIDRVIPTWRL